MYPRRTPFLFPLLFRKALWRVPVKTPQIFLSFDDGPIPGITDKLLDILDQSGAKAVFFCLGSRVQESPELAREILRRGHRIGNHSWSHPDAWKVSRKEFFCDVQLGEAAILRATGEKTALFRPPYGRLKYRNSNSIPAGTRVVMWDLMPGDFDPGVSAEECLRAAIRKTRPGSIVVFHDSMKAGGKMLEILPAYLEHFRNRGYSFPLIP